MKKQNCFQEIYERYNKQLKNLSAINNKLLICFAGIPGSGKTYLSKILEKRYKGIRINSDDIRKIIDTKITKETDRREEILEEFLLKLLKTFFSENRLIILDSGIERKYKKISEISKVKGWKTFIIKMVPPKNLIIRRIRKKDKERLEKHPEDIIKWFKEYRDFNKNIKSDFTFKNNSDLKDLFSKLDGILKN